MRENILVYIATSLYESRLRYLCLWIKRIFCKTQIGFSSILPCTGTINTGCPVVPHFPHFQNFVHIFKKFPHFPHFWENPLWKMATAAFWLRNVSYEGSNWRSSFALSVKHGFYFARTHYFSIEQQKATNNTWYMENTIQSEHPQLI